MIPFTVYDTVGRILRSGVCQDDCLAAQASGTDTALSVASNDELHWISDGQLTNRPQMALTLSNTTVVADGVTEVTLTGAPVGASIQVTGPVQFTGVADADPIILVFSLPGTYRVNVSLFPNQDAGVTINAT